MSPQPATHPQPAVETGHASHAGLASLTVGAVGVVYGDIGTSPIYALREALTAVSGDGVPDRFDVIGVLSIIVWSLTIIVSFKYIMFVLRADNNGEGGPLSLMVLARMNVTRGRRIILAGGMLGAALFFGDALITPAISVLSAVEGLEVAAPSLQEYVVPLTVLVIIGLFSVQQFGTASVARLFGPVTTIWFLVIGGLGLFHVFDDPGVLLAINPAYAVQVLLANPGVAVAIFGAAFLAVTGAEALYADLGHFGRRPIVLAWYILVFPALLLSYFGQAAFVLARGGPVGHPLFEMAPDWGRIPLVILATCATVIASQAVISGAFSLIGQAIQMNLLPRMNIRHTSEAQRGQIYISRINTVMMFGVLALVIGFGSSENLAAAYGISVTGEMVVTVCLLFVVMRYVWGWALWRAALIALPLLLLDLAFLGANLLKILDGGWVSIVVAAIVIGLMWVWIRGVAILSEKTRRGEVPLDTLLGSLGRKPPHLVPGTAVFLTSDSAFAPTALLHSLKHYKVLHERNAILTVVTDSRPFVPDAERVAIKTLNPLFTLMTVRFGYMERPDLPRALGLARKAGWKFDIMSTSFFLSRRSLKPSHGNALRRLRDRLFSTMSRNATDATAYFRIPTNRVVEIGTQVAL